MAKRFETVIRKARFATTGYTPQAMTAIAEAVRDGIEQRISAGMNVQDAPAAPLKPGYAKQKGRKAPPAVRNWRFTGRTLRSMKVLSAASNRAKIGFTDAEANKRAHFNNAREKQFGISGKDRAMLIEEASKHPFVQVMSHG